MNNNEKCFTFLKNCPISNLRATQVHVLLLRIFSSGRFSCTKIYLQV